MRIQSQMTPDEYISAMQEQMQGHFDFGQERFTGFIFGKVFSVTYHSGYEWNRRISNQKNTALGYVRKTADGSEVRCVCLRALMAPTQFLLDYCLLLLLSLFSIFFTGVGYFSLLGLFALIALAMLLVAAPISALVESFTDEGEAGKRTLVSFLLDPSDPYAHYGKIR